MHKTISELSRQLNLSEDVVLKVYKAYWSFIRASITKLPLSEDLDEQEFSKLKTNFNIPNLGKLYCNYNRYIGVRKRSKFLKEKKYAKYKGNQTNG